MADFVSKLGKTRLGYRLWRITRAGPFRPVREGITGGLRGLERAFRRRQPRNRAHDARQKEILQRFEAATRTARE